VPQSAAAVATLDWTKCFPGVLAAGESAARVDMVFELLALCYNMQVQGIGTLVRTCRTFCTFLYNTFQRNVPANFTERRI
jgi:hypothetical protein